MDGIWDARGIELAFFFNLLSRLNKVLNKVYEAWIMQE